MFNVLVNLVSVPASIGERLVLNPGFHYHYVQILYLMLVPLPGSSRESFQTKLPIALESIDRFLPILSGS